MSCPQLNSKNNGQCLLFKARRTLQLLAELMVTIDYWSKQVPPVCAVVSSAFGHSCHQRQIFNILNIFVHE